MAFIQRKPIPVKPIDSHHGFVTQVVRVRSGYESRNALWSAARKRYVLK